MRILKLLIIVLSAISTAALSMAADPGPPRIFGVFAMAEGSWAEYDIVDKKTGELTVMRMNVLNKDGNEFWYEVWMNQKEGKSTIKMLLSGDPNDPENVKRLILQSGDQKPVEMPRDFVVMGRRMAGFMYSEYSGMPADKDAAAKVKMETVGPKTVETQAGKFNGTEVRLLSDTGKQLAVYVNDEKVKPFGVVVSETEGSTMKLKAYGQGAKSRIKGTPTVMNTPPGMPRGMPRGMPPGMKGPEAPIKQQPAQPAK